MNDDDGHNYGDDGCNHDKMVMNVDDGHNYGDGCNDDKMVMNVDDGHNYGDDGCNHDKMVMMVGYVNLIYMMLLIVMIPVNYDGNKR